MLSKPFHTFLRVGHGVGQAVDPHFDPHRFGRKSKKNPRNRMISGIFWSCWADSNRRPHPYQLLKSPESTAFQCFRGLFIPEMCGLWSFSLHVFHPLVSPCGSRCGSNRFQDTNEGRTSDSGRPSRCALSRS